MALLRGEQRGYPCPEAGLHPMTRAVQRIALAALFTLFACSQRVPAVEPSSGIELNWCLRVMVKSKGERVLLAACAATREMCERLRTLARSRGGLMGLEAVGSCR